jgi:hypothetical protein
VNSVPRSQNQLQRGAGRRPWLLFWGLDWRTREVAERSPSGRERRERDSHYWDEEGPSPGTLSKGSSFLEWLALVRPNAEDLWFFLGPAEIPFHNVLCGSLSWTMIWDGSIVFLNTLGHYQSYFYELKFPI